MAIFEKHRQAQGLPAWYKTIDTKEDKISKKTKMISGIRGAANKEIAMTAKEGMAADQIKLCLEGKKSSLTVKEQNRVWKTMKDQHAIWMDRETKELIDRSLQHEEKVVDLMQQQYDLEMAKLDLLKKAYDTNPDSFINAYKGMP
ncbi:hypothetical protein NCC49_000691 [Naganishia albida]|nr:hypothetical protein NCC49_000691 [Naganishia albida]